MKNKLFLLPLFVCVATFFSSVPGASAASITNDDFGGPLVFGTNWFGGTAPGTGDIAVFDSNITAVNPVFATNVLGASTSWAGIQILNPAVPIFISATATN